MKRQLPSRLALACVALTLAACAQTPGNRQADEPPQLSKRGDIIAWNNASAFGPVPSHLASTGALRCAALDTDKVKYRALGYHSAARGLDGLPLPGGGYYCVPRD